MPVAVHRVVVGLRLAAALGAASAHQANASWELRAQVSLAQVGAVVALVVDEGQHRLDAGLVRLRQIDGSAHVAGGLHDGGRLCSAPTVAPASRAACMAESPDSPAPTTTTS